MRETAAITSLRSATAAPRAPQPGVEATRSASAARRAATSGGMRGAGGGAGACPPPPPHAARRTAQLHAVSEALRQRIRQPPFADLVLRPLDGIRGAVEARVARAEIEHEPRGPCVAVAGLSHRARVQERGATAELGVRPLRGVPALERAVAERDRERDVA